MHQFGRLGQRRGEAFLEVLGDGGEGGAQYLPGAGAGANDVVIGARAGQQHVDQARLDFDAVERMGDAGNGERPRQPSPGAVFHQIGHVKGEIALMQDIDIAGFGVRRQLGLRRQGDARQVFDRQAVFQAGAPERHVLFVEIIETIGIEHAIGQQRQHEILVGDGFSHIVLPELILDQEAIQTAPFQRPVSPAFWRHMATLMPRLARFG